MESPSGPVNPDEPNIRVGHNSIGTQLVVKSITETHIHLEHPTGIVKMILPRHLFGFLDQKNQNALVTLGVTSVSIEMPVNESGLILPSKPKLMM